MLPHPSQFVSYSARDALKLLLFCHFPISIKPQNVHEEGDEEGGDDESRISIIPPSYPSLCDVQMNGSEYFSNNSENTSGSGRGQDQVLISQLFPTKPSHRYLKISLIYFIFITFPSLSLLSLTTFGLLTSLISSPNPSVTRSVCSFLSSLPMKLLVIPFENPLSLSMFFTQFLTIFHHQFN